MRPTNAIQAFLVQALLDDADVAAIIGARVWDDVPDDPQHPYCSIGPNYHGRRDADDLRMRDHYFQIDAWSKRQGQREEINNLTDVIEAALDGAKGDLGDHALSECEVVLTRVLDGADGEKHGVIQVRTTVEEG